MRTTSSIVFLFVLLLFAGCNKNQSRDLVNPIVGDISFIEKFGFKPDKNTDNDLRVRTHLQYVARLLRKKDVGHLPQELLNKRTHLLDLLDSYAEAGKFPKNYDYQDERKPCFIDKDQTICAVGYLVEKTAGRAVAEAINADYKYENIFEMGGSMVDEWIASSGLDKEECAMIQPQYGYYPVAGSGEDRVKPVFAIGSAVLMGSNAAFNVINIVGIARGNGTKTAPVLGLLAGTTQVTMGAFGFARERDLTQNSAESMLTSQGKLSLFNIGMGTSTILLSTWNLVRQKKAAQKRTSWNIFGFPAGSNQTGIGLSFSTKI